MLDSFINNSLYNSTFQKTSEDLEIEDYSLFLKSLKSEYTIDNYYLQVNKINATQGWIIHLSVIISQVTALVKQITPLLIAEDASFKIVMDKNTANDMLTGYLGANKIGKIICIYPENDQQAVNLAKILIKHTENFRGPSVPTDKLLKNIVYTRYENFYNTTGNRQANNKYILNEKKELIPDLELIPFEMPPFVQWPFSEITDPTIAPDKKVLNKIYRTIGVLKSDVRGNVYKGIYIKKFLVVSHCVIKQGKKNMSSDKAGRDIHDRLAWQKELYYSLKDEIPLPEILDLFIENGDSYLAMKYIKGDSFYDRIKELNPNSKAWPLLQPSDQLLIVSYLIKIVSIVKKLHDKGYVHRDIAPGNFMINTKDEIFLIDIELTYAVESKKPAPPFEYGTAGFMSPEQQRVAVPTPKEDIYGIGGLLVEVLTGLSPVKFDTSDPLTLPRKLYFFLHDMDIANLISLCLNENPELRPSIHEIQNKLEIYRDKIVNQPNSEKINEPSNAQGYLHEINETITLALKGLSNFPTVIFDNIWCSKLETVDNVGMAQLKQYSAYPGLRYGIGGVIYLLSRAKKMGFEVDSSIKILNHSWLYVKNKFLNNLSEIRQGLYLGSVGLGLSLAEGVNQGLLDDNEEIYDSISKCILRSNDTFDLANGITGQGIAILRCSNLLNRPVLYDTLEKIIKRLTDEQQSDGSWIFEGFKKNFNKPISFNYGIVGIIWFLLEYVSLFPNADIKSKVRKSVEWLIKRANNLKSFLDHKKFTKYVLLGAEVGDERKGIILVLIKAHETFKDERYRIIAEKALNIYPKQITNINFSQENGLTAMGELYLEAWRVFNNPEWMNRAIWIAEAFTHTLNRTKTGSGYWKMEEYEDPTADLMIGNSGIIHFLLRCLDPTKIGYRLLK
ncbi:class III lanthionine synthetase LanKC N-terminal domain-containing protein [Dinghuibacter silviterrae]|uniref:Serine/threonine protein kinase n=1 Tax=Dinghuibacter silviterrae TaxID=1539049 RepID=A0A4R8DU16_9BACT|nr:lanthionine synthetase LanC family protein [Dinghuibacter silviterrae]TDX01830.1 serine/threonine protein kinase [Dinghuibacter silviterrae]